MSQHHKNNFPQVRSHLESRRQALVQRKLRVDQDLAHQQEALSADLTEQAVELQNDETLQAIGRATEAELGEVEEALQRLSQGDYGVCRDCGQPIAPLRLASLPQTVTCTACAR
jgi:RNA polymerase-binding transcription factor DksA